MKKTIFSIFILYVIATGVEAQDKYTVIDLPCLQKALEADSGYIHDFGIGSPAGDSPRDLSEAKTNALRDARKMILEKWIGTVSNTVEESYKRTNTAEYKAFEEAAIGAVPLPPMEAICMSTSTMAITISDTNRIYTGFVASVPCPERKIYPLSAPPVFSLWRK